jgi:hypothetical protein
MLTVKAVWLRPATFECSFIYICIAERPDTVQLAEPVT